MVWYAPRKLHESETLLNVLKVDTHIDRFNDPFWKFISASCHLQFLELPDAEPIGFDNDGHKPCQPQTMTMMATTMMATNHDDQLSEIYPTMLSELN